MLFDLHIHTRRHSPDSLIDPLDLVRRARELGLDGIVITEHDYRWPQEELEELRAAAPDLVILSGVEVSGRHGHVLVYGAADLSGIGPGIGWAELCREVRRQGGVALAAHPNRFGQDFADVLRRERPELDGIEVMSKNMDDAMRAEARRILETNPHFAALGNSDAHTLDMLAVCVTRFEAEVRTEADLVAAIRARLAVPCPRDR